MFVGAERALLRGETTGEAIAEFPGLLHRAYVVALETPVGRLRAGGGRLFARVGLKLFAPPPNILHALSLDFVEGSLRTGVGLVQLLLELVGGQGTSDGILALIQDAEGLVV